MRRWKTISAKKKWRAERGALDAREKQERGDRLTVRRRSGGICEVYLRGHRCWRASTDIHHVVKRSQGGKFKGTDYLMAICRPHHELADNASATQTTRLNDGQVLKGRLRVAAAGEGQFRCWMETATKTTTHRPGRAGTPTNRLSRETSAAFHAPKAPERSEAS